MTDEMFEELGGLILVHPKRDAQCHLVRNVDGQLWAKTSGSVSDIPEPSRSWQMVPWGWEYKPEQKYPTGFPVYGIPTEDLKVDGVKVSVNYVYEEWSELLDRSELEDAHGKAFGSVALQNGAL